MIAGKIVGYLLIFLGLAGLGASFFPEIKSFFSPILPEALDDLYLMLGGAIVAIVGVFTVLKLGKPVQKVKEVPIYEGKKVVGYRRN